MNNFDEPIFESKNNFSNVEKKPENNTNVYNKEKFYPEQANEYVEKMQSDFIDYYSSLGYIEEPSVLISSGVDDSVRFIGSPISVFKPYIAEQNIPGNGLCMHQDCIRTKNIDKMLDDNYQPNWGSYFPNMGAITQSDRISDGCNETFDFFEKKLNIDLNNILIRISSEDQDLLNICKERYGEKNMEIDTKELNYYRHKLGMSGIWGRNCNIALRNSNGEGFSDVANLIIIENSETKLCLEISIGVSTTLKQINGLEHVQDCCPVIGLESVDKKFRRKFEDSIVTSVVLFKEGLRPIGQQNKNRILKKYIKSLSYFRGGCHLGIDDLSGIIKNFEKNKFPENRENDYVSDVIVEYVKTFENDLFNKKDLIEADEAIKKSLL